MASMADSTQPTKSPETSTYAQERLEEKRIEQQRWIAGLYLFCPFLVVPALILSIAYAVVQNGVCALPAVGVVPMGLGAIYAIRRTYKIRARLNPKRRIQLSDGPLDNKQGRDLWARAFEIVINLTVAISILVILIHTWIWEPQKGGYWSYRNEASAPWLGANATFFMMVSMILHGYLAWLAVPRMEVLLDLYRSLTKDRALFVDTHGRCRSCRTVIVQTAESNPRPAPYTDV